MFECKNLRWHKAVSTVLLASVLLVVVTGCLVDPQRTQAGQLLDRLSSARAALMQTPPPTGFPCDDVADVKSRLMGEPGLVDVRPAWPALRAAADALEAVCGQAVLLAVPVGDTSAALVTGRARWQDGLQRQLDLACDNLRSAAAALGRATPC